ncbi:MAG: tRNA-dihydrouridine synthase family protein [Phycisphaerales bacterium]|nr:tRNA-dihydrouridine synthase family protein [Phycisphaerales bacterium]
MSCTTNNATPPGPAVAPGAEGIDPARVAERLALEHGPGGMDPRVASITPGFDAPFFQAGLAGYSDAAMRIIARRHGCPYCVTEALLDRALLAGGRGFAKADLGELHDNVPGGEEDQPLAGQIMGSDPAEMAAGAVKMIEQAARAAKDYRLLAYGPSGHWDDPEGPQHLRLPGGVQLGRVDPSTAPPSVPSSLRASVPSSSSPSVPSCLRASVPSFSSIDINLACPVKKISRKARGGHWLAEPDGAIAILEAVRDAVPPEIACTLKIRRSFDDTPEMAENFWTIVDAAYRMGYAWATVHARTVEQKYVGPSRWDLLREIVLRLRRDDPSRIIFGSGDIWSVGDIFRMIEYTGVNGASVARGCIGNPWIFRQARDLLAGRDPSPPTIAEQRRVLEEHFGLALAVNANMRKSEVFTGRTMRKFGIRFAEHHPRTDEVRRAFIGVDSLEDWRRVLEAHYGSA